MVKGLTNILITKNLEKYMGFYFSCDARSTRNGNFLLERMNARLSSWTAKVITFGNRTTLIKLVLSTMHFYLMQIAMFPNFIC